MDAFQKQVGAMWHLRGDRTFLCVKVGTDMQLRFDLNCLHVVTAGLGVCDRWIVKSVSVPGCVFLWEYW